MEKFAIIDYKSPYYIFDYLTKLNIKPIPTPVHNKLYSAVESHPDMLLHQLSSNVFICEPSCYEYFKKQINEKIKLIQGVTRLQRNYPYNIAYNISRISDIAFGKLDYVDKNIIEYYSKNGVKLINVNQGYAKCSTCIVSDKAVITADVSIAKALSEYIDVLIIDEGYIELKPFSYGFIGGATGLLDNKHLLISGSLKSHPSCESIYNFLEKYGVVPLEMSDKLPVDIGSIFVFETG